MIGAILTLGLGTFGSASLLITLGYASGAESGGGEIAGPRGAGPVLRNAQGERPGQRVYGRPQSTNTVRPGNRR